jgi:hypothetical protein
MNLRDYPKDLGTYDYPSPASIDTAGCHIKWRWAADCPHPVDPEERPAACPGSWLFRQIVITAQGKHTLASFGQQVTIQIDLKKLGGIQTEWWDRPEDGARIIEQPIFSLN